MNACVAVSAVSVLLSFLLRRITRGSVLFFEVFFVGTLCLIFTDILYGMIKFIPVKDEHTGQTKRWAMGT